MLLRTDKYILNIYYRASSGATVLPVMLLLLTSDVYWVYFMLLRKRSCLKLKPSYKNRTGYIYKVVQIWPAQTVTCLHTNGPGNIWTTLYIYTIWKKNAE
jgi:hypothetical protein